MDAFVDAFPDHLAATLIALLRVHGRDGRATVSSVARERGRSDSVVYGHLRTLESFGLVVGLGVDGALRPNVQVLVPA